MYVYGEVSPAAGDALRATAASHDSVVRIGYVAATRARERLAICGADHRKQFPY